MAEIGRYKIDPNTEFDSRYKKLSRIINSDGSIQIESQDRMRIAKSSGDIYHTVIS